MHFMYLKRVSKK